MQAWEDVHCLKLLYIIRRIKKIQVHLAFSKNEQKRYEFCHSHGFWGIIPTRPLLLNEKQTNKQQNTNTQASEPFTESNAKWEGKIFFPTKYIHLFTSTNSFKHATNCTLVKGWPLGTRVSYPVFRESTTINSPKQKGTDAACFFSGILVKDDRVLRYLCYIFVLCFVFKSDLDPYLFGFWLFVFPLYDFPIQGKYWSIISSSRP